VGAPTELVVYADEGHFIHTTDHQHDLLDRMIKWFDLYLKTDRASITPGTSGRG
jgi:dipeptidyl aminopeptidase/acylaminoacyl peptidase